MSIVRITAYGSSIGTGLTDPFHCDVSAVGKTNADHNPLVVANEYICSRLAMHIGLPVPAGGIVADVDPHVAADGMAYVSLNSYPEGERPPPAEPDLLRRQTWEVAGITVFDAWIVCGDRHDANVILDPELGVPLTFIDFDLALIALTYRGLTLDQLRNFRISKLPNSRHDWIEEGAFVTHWLDRVKSISRHTIEEVVYQARSLGAIADDHARDTIDLLLHRRDGLADSLRQEWDQGEAFKRVRTWGLM